MFHGVRERNGGKWVCEIREPLKKARIWLGTYQTPEMAARAHDVAAIALRGKYAMLNFKDSLLILPRASSNSAVDIRSAATHAAAMFRPPLLNRSRKKKIKKKTSDVVMTQSKSTPFPPPSTSAEPQPVQVESQSDDLVGGGFVDEEEFFDMPGLLRSMVEGLVVAPPQMKQEIEWEDEPWDLGFSLWTYM